MSRISAALLVIATATTAACATDLPPSPGAAGGASPAQVAPSAGTAVPPDGTYRVAITAADLASEGIPNGDGWSGTWTLEITGGTFALRCQPIEQPGRDCGNHEPAGLPGTVLESGTLVGGDQGLVTFDNTPPNVDYAAGWRLEGDVLTFEEREDGRTPAHLFVNQWTRIG